VSKPKIAYGTGADEGFYYPEWYVAVKCPEGSGWKIVTDGENWGMSHTCKYSASEVSVRRRTGSEAPAGACVYCDEAPPDNLFGYYQMCAWKQ
jgi:hypothetical protein